MIVLISMADLSTDPVPKFATFLRCMLFSTPARGNSHLIIFKNPDKLSIKPQLTSEYP